MAPGLTRKHLRDFIMILGVDRLILAKRVLHCPDPPYSAMQRVKAVIQLTARTDH